MSGLRHVKRLRAMLAMAIASTFMGCAQPRVDTVQSYAGPQLPRPDRILVHDFAVSSDQVKLDRGVSSRFLSALEGGSQTGQQTAAALCRARLDSPATAVGG
jgi:hypothetical protein